ncbi:YitT family protein [Lachnospiraceae bacterium 62-35]
MSEKWKILKNDIRIRCGITLMAVTVSAVIQTFVIQAFINPAGLLSGGFTGIAILLDRVADLLGFHFSTSLGMVLLNIPVAIMCSRSINIKFTFFSLTQVFLTSGLLNICSFQPVFQDQILRVLFGGVLMGVSIVIALRGNASTGGTDFIALYVSNKTGKSIWSYVFAGNVVILSIFGLIFGWKYAGYSIIFQFISTKVISSFHHRYERVTLQITTVKADEVMKAYVREFKHGISCVEAVGGYSRKKMYLLHTVISSYEAADVIHLLRETDPHIIINEFKTTNFYGKFYQAPIQ